LQSSFQSIYDAKESLKENSSGAATAKRISQIRNNGGRHLVDYPKIGYPVKTYPEGAQGESSRTQNIKGIHRQKTYKESIQKSSKVDNEYMQKTQNEMVKDDSQGLICTPMSPPKIDSRKNLNQNRNKTCNYSSQKHKGKY